MSHIMCYHYCNKSNMVISRKKTNYFCSFNIFLKSSEYSNISVIILINQASGDERLDMRTWVRFPKGPILSFIWSLWWVGVWGNHHQDTPLVRHSPVRHSPVRHSEVRHSPPLYTPPLRHSPLKALRLNTLLPSIYSPTQYTLPARCSPCRRNINI